MADSNNPYLGLITDAPTPATPAANDNPYLGLVDQDLANQRVKLRAAGMQAAQTSPAAAASQARDGATLGVPAAAVAADPTLAQAAKAKQIDDATANAPVTREAFTDPQFAKVAQNDAGALAQIENALKYVVGAPGQNGRYGDASLAGDTLNSFKSFTYGLAANANLLLGMPIAVGADKLLGTGTQYQDYVAKHFIEPAFANAESNRVEQNAPLFRKAVETVGNLAATLATIAMTGGASEVPEAVSATTSVAGVVMTALAHGAKSMAVPALNDALSIARQVYEQTGDMMQAARAGLAQYGVSSAGGALPMAAPGTLLQRAASGFAVGALQSDVSRQAMNLVLPQQMQRERDGEDMLLSGLVGMGLAGVLGPRAEPNLYPAIRQTYIDSARAEQAERGMQTLDVLSKLADATEVREHDPAAFKQTIARMAEDPDALKAVYVHPDLLAKALETHQVTDADLQQTMPQVAKDLAEARTSGADVRIPIEDYATHIAGSPLDDALRQDLRVDPDGMTLKEAQDHYAQQVDSFQKIAENAVKEKADADARRAELDEIGKQVEQQITATGRYRPDVARAYAEMTKAFYATMAERAGVTPKELFENGGKPLTVTGERGEGYNAEGAAPHGVHEETGLPLNADGTVTLYHHTSADAAEAIRQTGVLKAAAEPDVYLTTHAQTDTGYGDTAVPLRVDPAKLHLDDEFPNGRRDFRMSVGKPGGSARVEVARPDDVLHQSVTLRAGGETLAKYGLEPGGRYNTREVAAALEARQRELYGRIARDDRSAEAAEKIAQWMAEEVRFEMLHPRKSGVGWYSTKFQRALDAFGEVFPELKGRAATTLPNGQKIAAKEARGIMTALIAVTSDGQKVYPNFKQAVDIYRNWRETGQFTTERGHQRQSSIDNNLKVLQGLIDKLGPKATREYLLREATVKELRQIAKAHGRDFDTEYQAHIKLPMAATEFGPKLGAFYANLMGAHGYLTMDRWWSRTFNRYRGDLLDAPTRAGLERFKGLLGKPEMSDDEALAATVAPRNAYADRGFKNGSEIEKAANTLHKAAFEMLNDAPFNASDRTFMLDAVNRAQKVLESEGRHISVADIQAVLWYYEKRLYGEMGARESADISYEEAAKRVVKELGPSGDQPERSAARGDDEAAGKPVAGADDLGTRPGAEPVVDPGAERFESGGGEYSQLANNASGESSASLEAQSRLAREKAAGQTRVKVDKYGNVTPLNTVDGVDTRARAGEHILQRGVGRDPWTVLDAGEGSTPGAKARAIAAADRYAQGDEVPRGTFSPSQNTIRLLKDADLSTYLHEFGHFGLETLFNLADKSPGLAADRDAVLKWFGVKDADAWHAMGIEERRPFHEKFARGFEAYLMEGHAPTPALTGIFGRFRAWLINVYQRLQALNVELTPEVRGVMDRMLASEDAIHEAEQTRSYFGLDKIPDGADPKDFESYLKLGRQATDDAVSELTARSLRDMKWLTGARSRALAKLQREAREARKAAKEEATEQVDNSPEMKAKAALAEAEKAHEADPLAADMNTQVIADTHGFQSIEAMHRAIDQFGDRDAAIEGLTDRIMLERHGDLVDPRAMQDAANAAVHNDARARFMATGLKMLTKSPVPVRELARAAQEAAERIVAGRTIKDLRPDQYGAAETRANKEMLAAAPKDPAAAADAQRRALLNNRLFKVALDAQRAVEKGQEYLKRLQSSKVRAKIDLDIRDQIDDILARFDLRTAPPDPDRQTRAQQNLAQWLEAQRAAGYSPSVSPDVANEAARIHYKDMTVEQFKGLVDSIRALEQIGRQRQTITVDGQRQELTAFVQNELVPKIMERGERFTKEQLLEKPDGNFFKVALDHFTSWLRAAAAQLKPTEYKSNQYDRHEILGPFARSIFEPILRANYRKVDMLKGLSKDFEAVADRLGKAWQESLRDPVVNTRLLDPDLGQMMKMTRARMLGIALHVGNESNFDKLTRGWKWRPEAVLGFLRENMTAKDWQAVQTVWDLYEKHWPDTEAMYRRLGQTIPDKIEARPFSVETPDGEKVNLRGGYAAITYDPLRSRRGEKQASGESIDPSAGLFGRDYFSRNTPTNGSMNARVAGYTDRVSLDYHDVARKLQESIHDLAYREALIDAHKIIEHPEFRDAFRSAYGREAYRSLQDWIGRLANSNNMDRQVGAMGKFLQYTRTGLVINAIGFRISTVLKHGGSAGIKTLGYFAGGGEKYLASRMASMTHDWRNQIETAQQKFPEIRARLMQQDRDFKATSHALFEKDSALAQAERFGHAAVAWSDMMTAVPTAWAAYDRAITEGIPVSQGGTGAPMSEADAVAYASKIVREAHGSNIEAARSMVLNTDSEALKMFTTLYGFMNNTYGQMVDAVDKLRTGGISNTPVLARAFMALIVPAVWAGWLKEHKPDPSKGETWATWAGKAIAEEVAATVPFVRDAASMVEGYKTAGMVSAENWVATMVAVAKDVKQVAEKEGSSKVALVRDSLNALGTGLHIPGLGQLGTSLAYLEKVREGKEHPRTAREFIEGVATGHGAEH